MLSVKGHFKDGVAAPTEPLSGQEEGDVIITFLGSDNDAREKAVTPEGWSHLRQILREGAVETGIPDLAHEHDHYLHGTPKRGISGETA